MVPGRGVLLVRRWEAPVTSADLQPHPHRPGMLGIDDALGPPAQGMPAPLAHASTTHAPSSVEAKSHCPSVFNRALLAVVMCVAYVYCSAQVEAMRQRTGQANNLTSLAGPAIDWVALATGMGVPAGRAETCEQLVELIQKGLQQQGPFVIHAALA